MSLISKKVNLEKKIDIPNITQRSHEYRYVYLKINLRVLIDIVLGLRIRLFLRLKHNISKRFFCAIMVDSSKSNFLQGGALIANNTLLGTIYLIYLLYYTFSKLLNNL